MKYIIKYISTFEKTVLNAFWQYSIKFGNQAIFQNPGKRLPSYPFQNRGKITVILQIIAQLHLPAVYVKPWKE
jgi:hypothetical protein